MKREKTIAIIDEGESTRRVELTGRFAECLRALVKAGSHGVTTAEDFEAGTRVSHYIFRLRNRWGFQITTTMEPNSGEFGGEHARYHLIDCVHILEPGVPPGGLSARDFGQAA